jgi:hypothetical protein
MRILLMHEDTRGPGQGGGAESMLRDLTKALKDLDNEVAWLHSDNLPEAIDQFNPDIIQVGTIFNRMGWKPLKWLQQNKIPHIQACMDYYQFCGGRMLLKNWDEGCSAVNGVCNSDCREKHAPYEWLEIVNQSPVLALNEYTADIYKRNGMRADYIGELGVDTELFRPDANERKGCEIYTSSAWAEYPAKGMKYLKQAIEGTDIKVNLMTHLSREEVALGLKRASIFVFPSTYEETWGLCLQEALASGCACIASDVAGARAQIHEGMGILVPVRDPMAIRQAIYLLQSDTKLREQMGKNAREHVMQDHTLGAMGKRYVEIYRDVINRNSV